MGTLLRIAWINLRRDRVAQALTFILPIIFFSIFATVFGRQGDASTARIRIAVVDEDHSEVSARLIEGLRNEKSLRPRMTPDETATGPALDRVAAERLVRAGDVPVAVVIPHGLGEAFSKNGFAGGGPAIQLLRSPVAGYSSFGSVIRSNALGDPSLVGGVHQSRCSS